MGLRKFLGRKMVLAVGRVGPAHARPWGISLEGKGQARRFWVPEKQACPRHPRHQKDHNAGSSGELQDNFGPAGSMKNLPCNPRPRARVLFKPRGTTGRHPPTDPRWRKLTSTVSKAPARARSPGGSRTRRTLPRHPGQKHVGGGAGRGVVEPQKNETCSNKGHIRI